MEGPFARLGRRALLHNRVRLDRFKLASRAHVRERLLGDAVIASAVRAHAAEHALGEASVWRTVDGYIREIVPFFNVVAYYHVGYRAASWLLTLFYKTSVDFEDVRAAQALPRDAVVVYVMNHRSNADYVLVSYALAGQVAISYAVGEWARAFPLELAFKAFGSYFIRRRYREPLYHAVLERYVQLITREGVTQGIFVEGGLSRDGRLRAPKVGLLDYVLGIGRDPAYAERLHVIPVAVAYDRVLEDRSLLRELGPRGERPPRLAQAFEVAKYVGFNMSRLVARRWKRYGRAAVVVGKAIPLGPWFAQHADLFVLEKPERLSTVQSLCDDLLSVVGRLIPVTPVPLVCAALQTFDAEFVGHDALVQRIEEMLVALSAERAHIVTGDPRAEQVLERAWRMLRMRRVLARVGDGYVVLPHGRELVSYYANGISHLLGSYMDAVDARDALPASLAMRTPRSSEVIG